MDFSFILSNLHRFVRERNRAEERKDSLFLTRAVVAGVLLVIAIAVMFTQL